MKTWEEMVEHAWHDAVSETLETQVSILFGLVHELAGALDALVWERTGRHVHSLPVDGGLAYTSPEIPLPTPVKDSRP